MDTSVHILSSRVIMNPRRKVRMFIALLVALVFISGGLYKKITVSAAENYVTTANLNLRSGPGTGYSILAVIPKGTTVSVESISGGWGKLTYAGKTGYSSMTYLTLATAPTNDLRVTTANLNFRTGPGTSYSIIATIPKGTTVNVLSESGGWARFVYGGRTGYSSSAYLSKTTTPPSETILYYRVTTDELNIRSGPGTTYSIVGVIPRGATVPVYSVSGSWARVMYNGIRGYSHTAYLAVPSSTSASRVVTSGLVASTQKHIALTFDAGWEFDQTIPILNVLDTYGIKATFFVRAYWIRDNLTLAKEIVRRGHSLQNHSLNHPHMNTMTEAQIRYEFTESTKIFNDYLGIRPYLFRPPFGEYNSTVLKVAGEQGYPYSIMWTVDTHDWAVTLNGVTVTTDYIVNRVLNNATDRGIVLMHIAYAKTPQALPRIIEGLRARGYAFRTVNQMVP
jgi:peptidoglycan/xylan/chitin deacetylase (PgdA/CDA1 family)